MTRTGSSAIGLGHAHIASFPAIRAVVFAIDAEPDALLSLAVAAIAVTLARALRQVALRTENCGLHNFPSPLGRTKRTTPDATASTKHYRPARRARPSRKCQARNCCATGSNRCPPKKRAACHRTCAVVLQRPLRPAISGTER